MNTQKEAHIKPAPGRIVLFMPGTGQILPRIEKQPLAAIIAGVWSDTCVNLTVFDANGNTHGITSVPLVQGDMPKPAGFFCEWPTAPDQPNLSAEVQPTNKCTICGALWRYFTKEETGFKTDTWNLRSGECGLCCDNVEMGDQIGPLEAVPTPVFAENSLPFDPQEVQTC